MEALGKWSLVDFPEHGGSLEDYKAYVTKTLEARCLERWRMQAARHTTPVRYLDIARGPSAVQRNALQAGLSWTDLGRMRAWARCRAQARVLTKGKRKRAKCLFCEWIGPWQEDYAHVCSECPAFAQWRQDVVDAAPTSWLASRPDPRVWWAVLQAVPGARHFPAAVALAAEVEARAAALGKAEDTVAAQA